MPFYSEDNRPERVLGFIHNPSAPHTYEELDQFIEQSISILSEALSELERGSSC